MKVSASRVLRELFWNSYDNLGIVVLGNLLWLGFCLPILTAPAATAALFSLTNRIVSGKEATVGDFWQGFKKYFLRSFSLALIYLFLLVMVASSLSLYRHPLTQGWKIVAASLGAVNIWVFFLLSLMGIYILPLMVKQDIGVIKAIKQSALLALDNPCFTIAISIQIIAILFLSAFSVAGTAFLMMSLIGTLLNGALRELFRKYEGGNDEEREEKRSWREILKPWD